MIVQTAQRARGMALSLGTRVLTTAEQRALVKSALLIGVLTFAAKFVTLGRDMIVASRFGTSDANDAFLAAWILPGFVFGLLSGGLVGAIIPIQMAIRAKHGARRERAVVGEVLTISLVGYVLAMLLLVLGRSALLPIVAQGYSASKFSLTIQLSLIMMPALLIGGISAIWAAILNTESKFGLGAAAPMVVPAVSALLLLANPRATIAWLAAGFVIGTGLQAALLYLGLVRAGLSARFRWHGLLPETRSVLRQFVVLGANNAVYGAVGVVDTAMAATLGPGSQSTLTYANKLIVPLLAVSSTALATAVLPYFSRLVAKEDWDGLRQMLRTCIRLILAFSIPATAAMILLSRPIVSLLFQRGEFTAQDSDQVARVMATYALLLPVETLGVLMSRVVMSFRAGQMMLIVSVVVFLLNIGGDYVLKGWLGIQGIALATVINQTLSLCCLAYMWRRLQREYMAP